MDERENGRKDATIEEIGAAMRPLMDPDGNPTDAPAGVWRLEGYDEFDRHSYPLEGQYGSEDAAREGADAQLAHLARSQAGATDGFYGARDRVYVVSPDGTRRRHHGGGVAPSF